MISTLYINETLREIEIILDLPQASLQCSGTPPTITGCPKHLLRVIANHLQKLLQMHSVSGTVKVDRGAIILDVER